MTYPVLGSFVGSTLQYNLNRKAGTLNGFVPQLEATGAANIWAGTSGLALLHALNVKAGNSLTDGTWKELQGVCNQLAGSTNLGVDLASAYF